MSTQPGICQHGVNNEKIHKNVKRMKITENTRNIQSALANINNNV